MVIDEDVQNNRIHSYTAGCVYMLFLLCRNPYLYLKETLYEKDKY